MAATTLLSSFNTALKGNTNIEDVDAAIVHAGRTIAKTIDQVLADPEASASDKTKALYLMPHIVGILKELLATPAARKTFGVATTETKGAGRLALIKDQAAKSAQKR